MDDESKGENGESTRVDDFTSESGVTYQLPFGTFSHELNSASSQQDETPRDTSHGHSSESEEGALRDENVLLRRRLAESGSGFQERLGNQTSLIARLQDQLKDSQKRMADMEAAERNAAMTSSVSSSVLASPAKRGLPITSTPRKSIANSESTDELMLNRLLEEQERNSTLTEVNMTIRRELDETKVASVSLTSDLLKVTQEYDRTKREMHNRLEEYKKNEKFYLERLASEHRQMLRLWRSFQQLRRDYLDTRSVTKRNLSSIDSDLQRFWKGTSAACQKLSMWMTYTASSKVLEKNGGDEPDSAGLSAMTEDSSVEEMILENMRRLTESQNQKEESIRKMQQSLDELTEQKQLLESQILERDRQLEAFKSSAAQDQGEKDENYAEYLHTALRDLAEGVLSDGIEKVSPRRRTRSFSPGALRGRIVAETTVSMVKDALEKRQRETDELTARLRAAQQKVSELEKSRAPTPNTDRNDKVRLEEANSKLAVLQKERDGALQQKENLKTQLEYMKKETLVLERKKREAVEAHGETLSKNLEDSQKRILQLESSHTSLEDERDRAVDDAQRFKSDLAKLKNLLDSAQSALNESRDETANVQAISNRFERDANELRKENEHLKEDLKKMESKIDDLGVEIDRLTGSELKSGDQLVALQLERQSLMREKEEAVQEKTILEKKLDDVEYKLVETDRKKVEMAIDMKALRDEVDTFKNLESVWNHERSLLLEQLQLRESELHEFESQVNDFKKEHAQTCQQLKVNLEKQRDLETKLETCRRDLNIEHEKASNVVAERQLLISERAELEERLAVFVEQIHRFETQEKQSEEKFRARLLELERRLEEAEEQKKTGENVILDLTRRVEDTYEEKRSAESRANSLQAVVISQEDLLRAKETEKKNVQSRVVQLESQLRGRETQLKQISENLKTSNTDLEKANAEKRSMKSELDRIFEDRHRFRSESMGLTSEIHKLRVQLQEALVANEADKEKMQSLAARLEEEEDSRSRQESELDTLRSQLNRVQESENELRIQLESSETLLAEHTSNAQSSRDQLLAVQQQLRSSEQEKRMLEERLKDSREQLVKSKKDLKSRISEINNIEGKMADLERKSVDMESQLKALQKMLAISQETEADLKRQLENVVGQKQGYQTRFGEFEKKMEALESQKREWTNGKAQIDRELGNARHQITLYEDEVRKNEAALQAAIREREAMDKALRAMEKENMQLQTTVAQLQTQVARMEQNQKERQSELQRYRGEMDSDFANLQLQYQETLRKSEIMEKTYERRLKLKDDDIRRLQEQLHSQNRMRHEFVSKFVQKSQDVDALHAGLAHLNSGLESSFSVVRSESSMLPGGSSPPGTPAHASTPLKRVDGSSPLNSSRGRKEAKK